MQYGFNDSVDCMIVKVCLCVLVCLTEKQLRGAKGLVNTSLLRIWTQTVY